MDGRHAVPNHVDALFPFAPVRAVVALIIKLDRDKRAQQLLLVHLHAAADRVAVGRPIQPRRSDQIFIAEE